ncbi:preprotein translocase subunit YajC [Candidatus Dependentiae bacterium]
MLQLITLILPFAGLAAAYYLLIYKSQPRGKKINTLHINIGDKVVTKGGLIGNIQHKSSEIIILKLYDGTLIEISNDAIEKIIEKESN